MCIITRGEEGKDDNAWKGRRSIEAVGYQSANKKANILFGLYLQNNAVNNYLYLLHPGNIRFELIYEPWPFPTCCDEPEKNTEKKSQENLLTKIYGRAFEKKEGKLYQVQALSAWDTWYGQEDENATIWPSEEYDADKLPFEKLYPEGKYDLNLFYPFTIIKLGPFRKSGPQLLAFKIFIEGKSYEELIGNRPYFNILGPESLMLQIKYDFLNAFDEQRESLLEKLSGFEDYIGFGESYDIVITKFPKSDNVSCISNYSIDKVPVEPEMQKYIERYVTRYPRFVLSLKNNNIKYTREERHQYVESLIS